MFGGVGQHTSITFTEHLAEEGIRLSIGSVADAYDNALMTRGDRALQDRVHPHGGLLHRALPEHR